MGVDDEVVEGGGIVPAGPSRFVTVEEEDVCGTLPLLALIGNDGPGVGRSFAVVRNAYNIRQKLKNRGFRWNPATRDWWRAYGSRSDLETLVRDAFSAGVRCLGRRSAAVVREVVPDLFGEWGGCQPSMDVK